MLSMKEIDKQIQTKQAQLDSEKRLADQENGKVDQYRNDNELGLAQVHDNAADTHQSNAKRLQDEIDDLNNQRGQAEARVGELENQITEVQRKRDEEVKLIQDEINKLKGTY